MRRGFTTTVFIGAGPLDPARSAWESVGPGAMKCSQAESASRTAVDVNLDRGQIRHAVAQLPDRHRAMLYRSYYLRRTTTQIAADLRTDDNVVKDELHHALHALRMNLPSVGDKPRR